jgi:hypothetical protein
MLTVYAVGGTHDYLAWNRARYQAYQELNEDQGVPITSIDAGFELNAWNYDGVAPTGGNGRSWWFVTDDEFIIAFVKPPGYEVVAAYPFRPLLPGPFDTVYTYRRQRPKE